MKEARCYRGNPDPELQLPRLMSSRTAGSASRTLSDLRFHGFVRAGAAGGGPSNASLQKQRHSQKVLTHGTDRPWSVHSVRAEVLPCCCNHLMLDRPARTGSSCSWLQARQGKVSIQSITRLSRLHTTVANIHAGG